MRFLRTVSLVFLAVLWVTPALAQYGLYGSPEMLRMPANAPPAANAPYGPQYSRPYLVAAQGTLPAEPAIPQTPSLSEAPQPSPSDVPPRPGVVDQMLNGANGYGGGQGNNGSCRGCDGPGMAFGCGQPGCEAGCCCPWFGSLGALVMGRNNANKLWTTYQTGNDAIQLTNTQDIHMPWKWGGEVRFGRYFGGCGGCGGCGGQWGIEASYWSLDPSAGYISTLPCGVGPPTVSTPLHTVQVEFNGVSAINWFDNAAEHRLWRRNEFHNVEINLLRTNTCRGCNSPWSIDWCCGVRFFRFEEELTFASLQGGCVWGQDGGAHEVYLRDQVTNNLWGFQFGFNADYYVARSLRLYLTPKFGIFNNHIDHYFQLNLGDGTVATTGGSGVVGTYPVRSDANALSFLTQIDVGVDWMFTEKTSLRLGYRVLAATGIGLADNQIPPYLVDIPAIADVDRNGELIFHGAYIGLTYNF